MNIAWQFGDKVFLPLRLVQYNILGIFGVVAWIGMDMIILAISSKFVITILVNVCHSYFMQYSDVDLCVYDHYHVPEARYPLNVSFIVLANVLLTWTRQFGNQFGGSDSLKTQHEIVTLEPPPINIPVDVTLMGRGSDL